jgi:hypothetical protein
MAMVMKGRTTIRRSAPEAAGDPMTPRKSRGWVISPWLFDDEVKRSPTFAKLEQSYVAILAGVDAQRTKMRARSLRRTLQRSRSILRT